MEIAVYKVFAVLITLMLCCVPGSTQTVYAKDARQSLLVYRDASNTTMKVVSGKKQDVDCLEISDKGIELVKQFEGYYPRPYICPGGKRTIGYGHVIQRGERYTKLSEAQATELLKKDLQKYAKEVDRMIDVELTQEQYDALVSFTYNLGPGALQKSRLRKKVNAEQHHAVPAEFIKYARCKKKVLRGLVRRRKAEAQLYSA